ncbi:cation transporter [Magnetococcus marinus MC-1]|uniref:Trk system potassium uptake protein n=1 Tax=Magnetococcus marinus (strain ATCC BAA-1437 / JCM 17883 / MC-1) TaxID=156889 RepID=A0LD79_MAGMM|nr:TrkH family potassium uptake protein [Magnetococcus marinus]ABK45922.1 cation transporter [Magnetococcus marinus MC-1]
MNYRMNVRLLSVLALLLGTLQLMPLFYAWYAKLSLWPWQLSLMISMGGGGIGLLLTRGAASALCPRDGFFVTTAGWSLAIVLGAIPYVASHELGWAAAIFESSSGFTTTGSSILPHPEGLPASLQLWRSQTQWVGGMGMLLLTIAILPFLGVGGMQLMKAEVPGPSKERLTPRLMTTARVLWGFYLGLTVLAGLAYYFAGLSPFDALNHAFTTVATGGFSTKDQSFLAFSPAAQWWCILFMALAGTNFLLHYRLVMHRDLSIFKDDELRLYLAIMLGVGGAVALLLMHDMQMDAMHALRESLFQTVSLMTTTGFASTDWEQWPALPIFLLFLLMGVGGMAGSTSGGPKVVRVAVVMKLLSMVTRRLVQPNRVVVLQLGHRAVTTAVVEGCVGLLVATVILVVVSGCLLHLLGMDLTSALSAALTCVANVGPGYGSVGAMDNFSQVSELGKLLLAFDMLAGRLEIFTVLMLFTPGFWRR